MKNVNIGPLNINSLKSKFSTIKESLSQNLDVSILDKTKLDDSLEWSV